VTQDRNLGQGRSSRSEEASLKAAALCILLMALVVAGSFLDQFYAWMAGVFR